MATARVLADGSIISAGSKLVRGYYGLLSVQQDNDETSKLTIDWTAWLGAETISGTPTWTGTGLTVASPTVSGSLTSVLISCVPDNSAGTAEISLVTSGGRSKNLTVRYYGRDA